MKEITVTDAARNFSDYFNRVAYRQESFVLTKGGKAVAELRPRSPTVRVKDLPKIFASLPRFTPREAADFARDVKAARKQSSREKLRDPWES